jgi:hypothetical protein
MAAKPKAKTDLFANTPQSVQKLAAQAKTGMRQKAREEWWRNNKQQPPQKP